MFLFTLVVEKNAQSGKALARQNWGLWHQGRQKREIFVKLINWKSYMLHIGLIWLIWVNLQTLIVSFFPFPLRTWVTPTASWIPRWPPVRNARPTWAWSWSPSPSSSSSVSPWKSSRTCTRSPGAATGTTSSTTKAARPPPSRCSTTWPTSAIFCSPSTPVPTSSSTRGEVRRKERVCFWNKSLKVGFQKEWLRQWTIRNDNYLFYPLPTAQRIWRSTWWMQSVTEQ